MDLTIRPATNHDLEEVRYWLQADTGMTQLVGAFNPNREVIKLDDPDDCWVALQGGELVALASLAEDRANEAYIGFVVKPTARRHGVAKTFIPMLLARPEVHRFSKIIGTAQFGDTAVEKILRHAGFYQTGYDENGLIVFEKR